MRGVIVPDRRAEDVVEGNCTGLHAVEHVAPGGVVLAPQLRDRQRALRAGDRRPQGCPEGSDREPSLLILDEYTHAGERGSTR